MTLLHGLNDLNEKGYAELIKLGKPDFIEVKGYVFIGASRQKLTLEMMPLHEEIVDFSKKLAEFLPDYEIMAEHIPSRIVVFAKKKFKHGKKWHTWIDFNKWFKLVESGKEFTTEDYLKVNPTKTGLGGKGTLDGLNKETREKILKKHGKNKENQKDFLAFSI